MRELIENPVYMTYEEMEEKFKGKWIYITRCIMAPGNELKGGVPVVIADTPFENAKDRFYDQFNSKEYAPRCDANFKHKEELFFPTFFS